MTKIFKPMIFIANIIIVVVVLAVPLVSCEKGLQLQNDQSIDDLKTQDSEIIPGLYQTGAVALYKEQGAETIQNMLITSWDDLIKQVTIDVSDGFLIYCDRNIAGDLMLPNSITSIGYMAFEDCVNLTGINISDTVTIIGANAFLNCSGLTDITIPNTVKTIYDSAFENCSSLRSIKIGNGVKFLRNHVFYNCTNLTEIQFAGSVEQWNNIAKNQSWCDGMSISQIYCVVDATLIQINQ